MKRIKSPNKKEIGRTIYHIPHILQQPQQPSFYFVVTEKCDVGCSHCYMDAKPDGKSISPRNFEKAIRHLPKEALHLKISGGEVFSEKELLYKYLGILREENTEWLTPIIGRKDNEKIRIEIQTNGKWAMDKKGNFDENQAKSVLYDLACFGVKGIEISSFDAFHMKAGINSYEVRKLINFIKEGQLIECEMRGASSDGIMPIGRAKNLSNKDPNNSFLITFYHNFKSCYQFLDKSKMTIDKDGNVYACCYPIHRLPGNLILNSLDKISYLTKKDKRLMALNNGGIEGLALYDGFDKKETEKEIKESGNCVFCARHYGKNEKKD